MRTFARSASLLLALSIHGSALAADPATPPAAAGTTTATTPAKPAVGSAAAKFAAAANAAAGAKSADSQDEGTLVTNVVGSQEAPTVLNVVPWKDKEVKLEKKSPTISILNQLLQPLDRDVLNREVQYFRSLQEQKTQ